MEAVEPRYYTPDLYEFRIGLRYEIVEEDFPIQREFEMHTPLTHIFGLLLTKEVRVKVLDTNDIEEIGFKRVGNPQFDATGEYTFTAFGYSLVLRYGSQTAYVVIRSIEDPLAFPGFSGMCRNYTDLVDIVRLLGIHQPTVYTSTPPDESD